MRSNYLFERTFQALNLFLELMHVMKKCGSSHFCFVFIYSTCHEFKVKVEKVENRVTSVLYIINTSYIQIAAVRGPRKMSIYVCSREFILAPCDYAYKKVMYSRFCFCGPLVVWVKSNGVWIWLFASCNIKKWFGDLFRLALKKVSTVFFFIAHSKFQIVVFG